MFMRRVLRDAAGDDGGEAPTLGAGLSQAEADAVFLAMARDEYQDDGAGLFGDWRERREAALRRWDPLGALSARLEASDDDADGSSCAGSCYASELDGSCDGMGWSDDEELAASWAELRNRRHAEGRAQCDEGGRDADGG